MTTKQFKGKAIYNPSGKAGEYSYWACNFYNGCSNGCEYCYCKKGILAKTMGGDIPTLKKSFKDEGHALGLFKLELTANLNELQKYGLFFSFSTDPMLPETIDLTKSALSICNFYKVPVKILTKRVDWITSDFIRHFQVYNKLIAFGLTLTGHDRLEPGACTNQNRIQGMNVLHSAGFKMFASIEPIIDFDSSWQMIYQTRHYCDLYKIGLQSGKKYDKKECKEFIDDCCHYLAKDKVSNSKIYFKDGFLQQAGIERKNLPSICVERDYNMFSND